MKFTALLAVATVAADLDFRTENSRELFAKGACHAANRGSPIDLKSADNVKDKFLPNLSTDGDWKGQVTGFVNRGASIKFTPTFMEVGGKPWANRPIIEKIDGVTSCSYRLKDFEYLPNDSWHTISGSRSKAELVLTFDAVSPCEAFNVGPNILPVLNRNAPSNIADHMTPKRVAMSILLTTGDSNPSLQGMAASTNDIKAGADAAAPSTEFMDFDINNFLKASEWKEEFYMYYGSELPTTESAACDQDTLWIVQNNKGKAKRAEFDAFKTYTQVDGTEWGKIKNMHAEQEDHGVRSVKKSFGSSGGFGFWG